MVACPRLADTSDAMRPIGPIAQRFAGLARFVTLPASTSNSPRGPTGIRSSRADGRRIGDAPGSAVRSYHCSHSTVLIQPMMASLTLPSSETGSAYRRAMTYRRRARPRGEHALDRHVERLGQAPDGGQRGLVSLRSIWLMIDLATPDARRARTVTDYRPCAGAKSSCRAGPTKPARRFPGRDVDLSRPTASRCPCPKTNGRSLFGADFASMMLSQSRARSERAGQPSRSG